MEKNSKVCEVCVTDIQISQSLFIPTLALTNQREELSADGVVDLFLRQL